MKNLITAFLMFLLVATVPATASANQYGQGTVLGEEEEEVTKGGQPLPATGLAENIAAAVGIIGIGAGYFIYKSRNKNSVTFNK